MHEEPARYLRYVYINICMCVHACMCVYEDEEHAVQSLSWSLTTTRMKNFARITYNHAHMCMVYVYK